MILKAFVQVNGCVPITHGPIGPLSNSTLTLVLAQPKLWYYHAWLQRATVPVNGMGLLPDTWNCGLRMRQERFPRHRLQWKPLVSDPGIHHGTYVTHVPWCMSGSLTRGGGEKRSGIPGACATRKFTYLARRPCPNHVGCTSRPTWSLLFVREILDPSVYHPILYCPLIDQIHGPTERMIYDAWFQRATVPVNGCVPFTYDTFKVSLGLSYQLMKYWTHWPIIQD